MNVTTLIAAALGKIVLYDADATGKPATLILETGDLDFSTVNLKEATVAQTLRRRITYWIGMGIDRHTGSERCRAGYNCPQGAASDIGLRHRSTRDVGLPRFRYQRRSRHGDLAARRMTASARKSQQNP